VIEQASEATHELVEALARLVPQLSSARTPPSAAEIAEIAATQTLLVARDALGTIVGALTLVVFRVPTGLQALIEDVVVDEAARGNGVGDELVQEATRLARAAGASSLGLTSRPSREAANRLYRRLGFERRETNVYRLEL
jgi:ribosomal protein S18 acetylase RimI-like enzyme